MAETEPGLVIAGRGAPPRARPGPGLRRGCLRPAGCLALLLALASGAGRPAVAEGEYEVAPALLAHDVLGTRNLAGPGYRVIEEVVPEAYLLRFRVQSDFGLFVALGQRMLDVRLREIATLSRAVGLANAAAPGAGIGRSLGQDPEEPVRIILDPATNVTPLAEGAGTTLGRITDFYVPRGEGGAPSDVDGAAFAAARRQAAVELGLDVYSTNPKVQGFLSEVALARVRGQWQGSLEAARLPPVGAGIQSADQLRAEVDHLLASRTPAELEAHNDAVLADVGVAAYVRRQLFASSVLTPRNQTVVTAAVMIPVPTLRDVARNASISGSPLWRSAR